MKTSTSRILVPVNFSPQSSEGLFQAIQIAKATKAKIYLLHVFHANMPPWNLMGQNEKNEKVISIEQVLVGEAKRLATDTMPEVTPVVVNGNTCDTILEQAEKLKINTIVIGTSTAPNIKKRIIGSNALRIVSESTIPVITVKEGCASKEINKIIVPLDLTKETREKVTNAVQLAKYFRSKIYAVSFSTTMDDGIVGHLKGQLRQVESFVKNAGIEIETQLKFIEEGNRRKNLINYVQEKDADMVIITTQQQAEIIKFFIGSFAQDVIQSAPVPVLSIVPKGTFKVIFKLPGTH